MILLWTLLAFMLCNKRNDDVLFALMVSLLLGKIYIIYWCFTELFI